jgi:flagellar hook-length control protein FliK
MTMSSNFPTSANGLLASRGAQPPAMDLTSALSVTESEIPQGQDFASWMAQHRELQQPVAPQATTPQGPKAVVRSINAALQNHASPLDRPKVAAAPKAKLAEPPAKPAAAKPAAKATAPQGQAKVEGHGQDAQADQGGPDDAKEVRFKTPQGEASAWVKELSPPAELPASDPAAMLAWLASLTQQDSATTSAALTEAGAALGNAAPGDAKAGADRPGSEATPSTGLLQVLGGKDLAAMSAESGQAGGQSHDSSPSEQDQAMASFSALMGRETARVATGASPLEGARHYTGSVNTPVSSPQFAQALADRVNMWISGPAVNGPMTAELRLNPAEMGPVHIRIELDGQNAMVDFAAAHQQTREAIESSLTLLSGALESAGLTLSGGGVSDQSAGQSWRGQGDGRAAPSPATRTANGAAGLAGLAPEPARVVAPSVARPGGLDLYA